MLSIWPRGWRCGADNFGGRDTTLGELFGPVGHLWAQTGVLKHEFPSNQSKPAESTEHLTGDRKPVTKRHTRAHSLSLSQSHSVSLALYRAVFVFSLSVFCEF